MHLTLDSYEDTSALNARTETRARHTISDLFIHEFRIYPTCGIISGNWIPLWSTRVLTLALASASSLCFGSLTIACSVRRKSGK